ncbi:DUF2092 domain-containing protein [Mangrovimonas sp. TPBH4]|uniref:DUF2092 domain-containing protein n=1 Tax=Mangrovimonas sp. TPBH4 TaxID=1645914 RepID=UPI0006B4BD63|nr:DUF2092 domain-containing protein [Mangrovimonas sp. TPBH4]
MKNILLLALTLVILPLHGHAQSAKDIDAEAVRVLDQMTDVISELTSCSVHVKNAIDSLNAKNKLVKYHRTSDVKFSGPDKLLILMQGDTGHKGYWYDGSFLTYYSYDENNYITLETPNTTLEMIDAMHKRFDFEFPGADFFYPHFVDDILDEFQSVKYKGSAKIDGENCDHVIADNDKMQVEIWVSKDAPNMPKRFLITHKDEHNRQYESVFSNWNLSPVIPDETFVFTAPANSKLISVMSKL